MKFHISIDIDNYNRKLIKELVKNTMSITNIKKQLIGIYRYKLDGMSNS